MQHTPTRSIGKPGHGASVGQRLSQGLQRLGQIATVGLLAAALPSLAQAQFPERSIRMYVGYPAGGGVDTVARALAERLSANLGQSIVVENRTGATGTIAADAAAKSNPDGYSILFAETGLLIAQSVMPNLHLDVNRDFTPVAGVARLPLLIAVHPSVPAKSTDELIALLKDNPGKYSYGSAGVGTVHHFTFELFAKEAGVEATHVPYKGGGPMLPDLIEGRIEIGMLSSSIAAPHIQSGRIQPIAVTTAEPVSNLPDVPTLAEALPGLDAAASFFVLAPQGTPENVVNTLYEAVAKSVESPEFLNVLNNQGALPSPATPAELAEILQAEATQWREIAEIAGIKEE